MARSNKDKYIDGGVSAVEKAPVVEHEFEQADVQHEILNPKTIEITLTDGKKFQLPTEWSYGELKQGIQNKVFYFQTVFFRELSELFPRGVTDWANPMVTGVLFKDSVITAMEELLAKVFGTAKSTFADKLDPANATNVLTWVVSMLKSSVKSKDDEEEDGEPEPPNE